MMIGQKICTIATLIILCVAIESLHAQDNYEIQVYGSETVKQGYTMVELHSNYTNRGFTSIIDGVTPDNHALHETVEITHGLTPWMELGFYFFTSANTPGYAPNYVGDHLRWRVRDPAKWHLPVGISLSIEAGYQRPKYAPDDWDLEIRPIVDKEWKYWYAAFNPVVDYSFRGYNHTAGPQFSPQAKVYYKITKHIFPGVEYYGGLGAFNNLGEVKTQQNQIAVTIDLDVSPVWEFNAGYVWGLTPATEHGIIKAIVGRRFGGSAHKPTAPPTN